MNRVEVIAVVGACAPERQQYAQRLAIESGRMLIPASRLAEAPDATLEAAALVPRVDHPAGAVVEFPAATSAIDLIGALVDQAATVRLTAVICVVDAMHLLDDLASDDYVATLDAHGQPREHTARALLTVTQLEYASMVVLVGWEALDTPKLSAVMALASNLSPRARLRLHRDTVDRVFLEPEYLAGQDRAGWVGILNGDANPHMTDPRVGAFRYEQVRPLHPGRLKRLLDERIEPGEFGLVIRSAGFCRFATRPRLTLQWEHVGRTIAFQVVSTDDDVVSEEEIVSVGQELAFIGLDLRQSALTAALDAAALTDAELAAGPRAWARFSDPFPAWNPAEDLAD